MKNYAQHLNPQVTPQSQPLPGAAMVPNAAGGFVYELSNWDRLRRFLILGCEGGSYYESERKLTVENAGALRECVAADSNRVVDLIVKISDEGLAPKNDSAIFALACTTAWAPSDATRQYAFKAVPKVCRIGTHLFQFVQARQDIGAGWGRGMRRAIGAWYDRPDVITQVLKYQQRNGFSHRDVLRLAHPPTTDHAKAIILDAICRPAKWAEVDSDLVRGWLEVQKCETAAAAAKIISAHNLQREMVPTQFLTEAPVWDALLPHMGMTALVRNLANLSKCGLLTPLSPAAAFVADRLTDPAHVARSRIHPFAILLAARAYASGRSDRGNGTWTPVPQVLTALDEAFDLAFGNVKPTGKRFVLAVDVSGSMGLTIAGSTMSSAEAAAAMALVTARIEPNYYIMGFATDFRDLGITKNDSLPTVLRKTRNHNFGGTDTSVAVNWALKNKVSADAFVIYTDNETWAGDVHTSQAIKAYRKATSIDTKLAVVGFTATSRTIADGGDHNSMDFVGLDASLPQALTAFMEV